jgi:HEAT repeat protein
MATISLLAALLLMQPQATTQGPLPTASTTSVPDNVREWSGFGYLPAGARTLPAVLPTSIDWSRLSTEVAPNAAVWRTKVVILRRVDRNQEHGGTLFWPGHHELPPASVNRVRRALVQLHALASTLSKGGCNLVFDISEEADTLTTDRGSLVKVVDKYLLPRFNGGRYEAEDGIFRGPYQSVIVIHPLGSEGQESEVHRTPVNLVGLPDVCGLDADGALATSLSQVWIDSVRRRAALAGFPTWETGNTDHALPLGTLESPLPYVPNGDWTPILAGTDDTTEARLKLQAITPKPAGPLAAGIATLGSAAIGPETHVQLADDPQRGKVLVIDELGYYRGGGFALPRPASGPAIDAATTPTLRFWMKSAAQDPIVIQVQTTDKGNFSYRLGIDVPFAYDNAWHPVSLDLKASGAKSVDGILIGPDAPTRASLRQTIGPITASFAEFKVGTDTPDARPAAENPSPNAITPEARATWAATAGPGEARRLLFKDPSEPVRANALAAALAQPDPADEPALIESGLYNYDPTVFGPAIRALGNVKTPTAEEGLKKILRTAASDRARGLAAEILADSHDPKLVSFILPLNQARSRAARLSAVHALGKIPGNESALMRMAFLPQDDPEIKLETTLTADVNDDYQGRKLLWSAVNEPSDAVRLESLRRLSYATVKEFQTEGMKGVRDDSVGVRTGLLEAWTLQPKKEFIPSIRLALTDRSPRVRAAAVAALAANPEPIDEKDLTAAFADPDPSVARAVQALAKQRGIEAPKPTGVLVGS